MTGKRERASYNWSGKWREISQQITRPSNLKNISKKDHVAAANHGEKGVSRLFLAEKMARYFEEIKSRSGCQWRENGYEQDFNYYYY